METAADPNPARAGRIIRPVRRNRQRLVAEITLSGDRLQRADCDPASGQNRNNCTAYRPSRPSDLEVDGERARSADFAELADRTTGFIGARPQPDQNLVEVVAIASGDAAGDPEALARSDPGTARLCELEFTAVGRAERRGIDVVRLAKARMDPGANVGPEVDSSGSRDLERWLPVVPITPLPVGSSSRAERSSSTPSRREAATGRAKPRWSPGSGSRQHRSAARPVCRHDNVDGDASAAAGNRRAGLGRDRNWTARTGPDFRHQPLWDVAGPSRPMA